MSELEVDAVGGASFVGFDSFEEQEESQSTHWSGSIFVPPYYPIQFCNHPTLNFHNQESLKANATVKDRLCQHERNTVTKGNKAGDIVKKESEVDISAEGYTMLTKSRRDDNQEGGSWEAGIRIGYGGGDETQVNGYVKGEAHDDKGNYVEGGVDHNFNRNEGTVDVHGGNKNDKNK